MDPDTNLKAMRRIVESIMRAAETSENGTGLENDGVALAGLVEAMDEWLSRGGFLPAAWRKNDRGGDR